MFSAVEVGSYKSTRGDIPLDRIVAKEREGEEDSSKKAPFPFFSLVLLVVLSSIY